METKFVGVSVKGILFVNEKIILLKNDRNEWELPGGRIDIGETPQETLKREIYEELGLEVSVGRIIDSWIFKHMERNVLILTYECYIKNDNKISISHEHIDVKSFDRQEIFKLENFPEGYKNSLKTYFFK